VENDELYELVVDAVKAALAEEAGGHDVALSRRMLAGAVAFRDDQGKVVKEVPVSVLFRKVTSIREKLRVLEQKLNNHPTLDDADKAELQGYVTRCYGSLTTFNFLFRDEEDKFKGTGGE
jgi:predicted mannosyl-3-phosphoglycerate phosphatase (HAD superfamily)